MATKKLISKSKKAAPAKKPVKKAAVKKAAPVKKAVPKKAAPAKKAAPKKAAVKKSAIKKPVAKKPASPSKAVKKAAPAKKTTGKASAAKPVSKKVIQKKDTKTKASTVKASPARPVAKKAPAAPAPKPAPAVKSAPAPVAKSTVKPKAKAAVRKTIVEVPAPVRSNMDLPVQKPAYNMPERKQEVQAPRVITTQRYSDADLAEFKTLIIRKLEDAREELVNLQAQIINANENGTDDTGASFKMLEDGSDTLAKEDAANMAARQKKFIEQLEAALIRIENKTYGICRVTGKLIPKERLRAVPHTTQSMEAKLQQYKD